MPPCSTPNGSLLRLNAQALISKRLDRRGLTWCDDGQLPAHRPCLATGRCPARRRGGAGQLLRPDGPAAVTVRRTRRDRHPSGTSRGHGVAESLRIPAVTGGPARRRSQHSGRRDHDRRHRPGQLPRRAARPIRRAREPGRVRRPRVARVRRGRRRHKAGAVRDESDARPESVDVVVPGNSPTGSVQPVAVSDVLSGAKMDVQPLAGDDFQSLLT